MLRSSEPRRVPAAIPAWVPMSIRIAIAVLLVATPVHAAVRDLSGVEFPAGKPSQRLAAHDKTLRGRMSSVRRCFEPHPDAKAVMLRLLVDEDSRVIGIGFAAVSNDGERAVAECLRERAETWRMPRLGERGEVLVEATFVRNRDHVGISGVTAAIVTSPVESPDRGPSYEETDCRPSGAPKDRRLVASTGALAPEVAWREFRRRHNEVRLCYERAVILDAGLAGKLRLTVDVAGDGSVTSAFAEGMSASIHECVTRHARRWTFPKAAAGSHLVAEYALHPK